MKHPAALSWGLIVLAVGVIFYGLNCYTLLMDEGYMALCCKDYANSPLAMMIFFIGNKWMSLCGDSFMSLRVLCRICIIVSISIGGYYLWTRTRNLLLVASTCLLSALTVNLADFSIYNWDTGAYPVESLGTLVLLLYVHKPTIKYAILLGVSWGLMTVFRLPLVAFGGIAVIAICGVHRSVNSTAIKHLCVVLIGMLGAWMVCIIILTGSVTSYIESFRPENIITGHSINFLQPYIDQFVIYFPRQVFFGMPALIAMLVAMIYSYKGHFSLKPLFIIEFVLLVVAFAFTVSYLTSSAMLLSGIGLPIFLVLVSWPVVAKYTGIESADSDKFTYRLKLQLWLLFFVMLLMGLGSDTAFQRWSILFLLPMVVGVIWPEVDVRSKKVVRYAFSIMLPFLLILIPIKYKMVSSEAEEFAGASSSVLSGTIIPTAEQERYIEVKAIVDSLNSHNVDYTFAGLKSRYIYSFEYEKGRAIYAPLHYYHWEDGNEVMVDRFAPKTDAIIYLADYPKDFEYLQKQYHFQAVAQKKYCTVLSKIK